MRTADWIVAAVYFVLVVGLGTLLGGRQKDARDYFLGHRDLPWWAILISVVATETSALTVISIPGLGNKGDLTFLQLAMGYTVGRVAVAWLLLPGYFRGEISTAYEVLGTRWGDGVRRAASAVFLFTRALATAVRLFAGAIPLAVITGWPYPKAILAVGVATVIYTYVGGLRAVVWMDVLQWSVYILAGIAALAVAIHMAPDGLAHAAAAGKLRVVDLGISLTRPYALGTAVIGGAFLSAASHGTDHLIVQRLLATRSLGNARIALVGSGLVVMAEFTLFLLVGVAIWAADPVSRTSPSDSILPGFAALHLPAGLGGLLVAGIVAAAMGSTASALNSLASSTTHDYYARLTGRPADDPSLLGVGRLFTLGWAVVLVLGALLFRHQDAPVVVVALAIASLTYGALLGTFILARVPRVGSPHVITAIVGSTLLMAVLVFAGPIAGLVGDPPVLMTLAKLAWPWYVLVGTGLTVLIGLLASGIKGVKGQELSVKTSSTGYSESG